jgi:hypothetical protein
VRKAGLMDCKTRLCKRVSAALLVPRLGVWFAISPRRHRGTRTNMSGVRSRPAGERTAGNLPGLPGGHGIASLARGRWRFKRRRRGAPWRRA